MDKFLNKGGTVRTSRRRTLDGAHHYRKEDDFLRRDLAQPPGYAQSIGKSSMSFTKFGNGFQRRRGRQINASGERIRSEQKQQSRKAANDAERQKLLNYLNNRNGNVIKATNQRPAPPASVQGPMRDAIIQQLAAQKQVRGRGRVQINQQQRSLEDQRRKMVGPGRYHVVRSAEEMQERRNRYPNRQPAQSCSILGYGRDDIRSNGVSDAFSPVKPFEDLTGGAPRKAVPKHTRSSVPLGANLRSGDPQAQQRRPSLSKLPLSKQIAHKARYANTKSRIFGDAQ